MPNATWTEVKAQVIKAWVFRNNISSILLLSTVFDKVLLIDIAVLISRKAIYKITTKKFINRHKVKRSEFKYSTYFNKFFISSII